MANFHEFLNLSNVNAHVYKPIKMLTALPWLHVPTIYRVI